MPMLSSFALILLAELPDKTLYTILLLSMRNQPVPVLLGAWAAFLVHGFIALVLGNLLSALPASVLSYGTAGVFLLFGVFMLFRRVEEDAEQRPVYAPRALLVSFALVFVAEWGDATQVGTAALVARNPEHHWLVLCGATMALWTGAALAVTAGRTAGRRVPKFAVQRAAGFAFCAFGIFSAVHGIQI